MHVVLRVIFLKFVSDKFEAHRQKRGDDGLGDYLAMVEYT